MDDKRLIYAVVGLLFVAFACVGTGAFVAVLGFGAYAVTQQGQDGQAGGPGIEFPWADDGDPVGQVPSADPGGQNSQEAAARMRRRYRPGPHVEVEGMLPSGRLAVRQVGQGARDGRTVDTPWIVGGAELHPTAAPSASAASPARPSLAFRGADQPFTVLAGVPLRLPLRADPGAGADTDVTGLYIAFHDYPGHFFLPASVDTELGTLRVTGVEDAEVVFGLDAALAPDGSAIVGTPRDVVMYVAAVDHEGRVSPYVQRTLRIMPVGTGDVEVTLTMNRSTDLDLYVIDPGGTVVYYANTSAASGGRLDLDANAACSSNLGVDNEHIYWPAGAAPAGTYTVRVANFESCIGGGEVDYRVTIQNCGETVVLAGQFTGIGDTRNCDSMPTDQPGWCQQVVEFEVEPCEGGGASDIPSGPIGTPGQIL